MKYKVKVIETLEKVVEIEAANRQEAHDKAEIMWFNGDEIICAEVYRKHGDKEWRVSPHIEIVDPETNDWDGINYNVCEL